MNLEVQGIAAIGRDRHRLTLMSGAAFGSDIARQFRGILACGEAQGLAQDLLQSFVEIVVQPVLLDSLAEEVRPLELFERSGRLDVAAGRTNEAGEAAVRVILELT